MRPILFHFGPASGGFSLHSYGVMLMIAFAVALSRTVRAARKRQAEPGAISPTDVVDAGVWMILWGIIGARVFFILTDLGAYRHDPASWLRVWEGGISFHGSLIGGIGALVVYCLRRRISVLKMADLYAPSAMIAYAIGRVGCLLNGCCYGVATTMPWGMRFLDDGHWTPERHHPTQLYASAISLVFYAILLRMESRKSFDGQLMCWYLILAGIERFVMEIWRAGVTSTVVAFDLTDVQYLCLAMIVGASIGLATLRRRGARSAQVAHPALGVTGQ